MDTGGRSAPPRLPALRRPPVGNSARSSALARARGDQKKARMPSAGRERPASAHTGCSCAPWVWQGRADSRGPCDKCQAADKSRHDCRGHPEGEHRPSEASTQAALTANGAARGETPPLSDLAPVNADFEISQLHCRGHLGRTHGGLWMENLDPLPLSTTQTQALFSTPEVTHPRLHHRRNCLISQTCSACQPLPPTLASAHPTPHSPARDGSGGGTTE